MVSDCVRVGGVRDCSSPDLVRQEAWNCPSEQTRGVEDRDEVLREPGTHAVVASFEDDEGDGHCTAITVSGGKWTSTPASWLTEYAQEEEEAAECYEVERELLQWPDELDRFPWFLVGWEAGMNGEVCVSLISVL